MTQVSTNYEHVVLNEKGVPVIKGTRFKVVHIVASKMAHGWSPEEIHFQYPDLTMGQIYSALAYYHDHEQFFEEIIEKELATYNIARKEQDGSAFNETPEVKGTPLKNGASPVF